MGVERPHAMDRGSSRIECSCHRRWTRRRWLMFDSDALSRDVDVPWRRDEGSRIPFADRRVEILHFESYHHIRTWKREGFTSSTPGRFSLLTSEDRNPPPSIRIERGRRSRWSYTACQPHWLEWLWVQFPSMDSMTRKVEHLAVAHRLFLLRSFLRQLLRLVADQSCSLDCCF